MSGPFFVVIILGVELLLTLSEQRPGMLLNILQSAEPTPKTENDPAPNINSAEVEKLWPNSSTSKNYIYFLQVTLSTSYDGLLCRYDYFPGQLLRMYNF